MATDNSSSLSKDETIEQLRETIGQLETVIQKLEETTVAQLPSSGSLQNLLATTSELETIIAQEVVTQETATQEAIAQVEQEQISQEVDSILELTTTETEPESAPTEQVIETPEQLEPEASPTSTEKTEQEAVSTEQIAENPEQPDEQSEPEASTEKTEQEAVHTKQVAENSEQPDEQSEPEDSSDSTESVALDPEVLEAEVTKPEVTKPEVTKPEVTKPEVTKPKEPVKQAVKATEKQKSRKQNKNKPKNQVPKKKKGWLVGVLVAAIAVVAITLTLKFAPISELPQLVASKQVMDKPVNIVKTDKSAIKPKSELPLETPIEIEEITENSLKIDSEKIASQPREDYQVKESTPVEPDQIDSTPTELDPEQPSFAANPEPETEVEPEEEQVVSQEEELEESLVVAEEPKPITKLTSEQNLIVALGKKTDHLAERYDDELIVAINPDFVTSIVSVTLSDDWYQLLENRQDRLLSEMFRRSQQLEFDKLMITDSDNNLIARSPVIGKEMVVFRRNS